MTVLPVVAREMGVLARRKSMYWSRWVTAVLALLVMLWFLVVSASQLSFAELGASIFLILSSLCFTFTVLIGTQATADCLSEEKREGTLGLLFLTDLKGFDVIGGKLAASSMQSALALIGVLPMISLSLLLGGVTLRQFGEVALVLVNTMFLSLAVGAFVSSLSRNERKAMVGTFVVLFVIVLGPWIVGMTLRQYLGFPQKLLAISPLYDFAMIHSKPIMRPPGPSYFWHSLIGLHLLGWLLLGISAFVLPRCVNELPALRFRRLREFADRFVYGRLEDRKKHRAELLDQNAFLWLASRERVKPRYTWGVLAFFVALYIWVALQFNDMLFDLGISAAITFLTHLVFKIWAASEVCSRLIQDRRSGALELLLSTPLSVKQIAEGQSLALRRLFLKPIVVLLLIEIFLLFGGLNAPRQSSGGDLVLFYIVLISTFLVDLWALKWVGLWLSLTGKSIERVLIFTIGRVLFLPWLVYAAAAGLFAANIILMDTRMDEGTAVFGWGLMAILISGGLGFSAREKFLTQFRELATRRFDGVVDSETEEAKLSKTKAAIPKQRRSTLLDIFKRSPVASSVVLILLAIILGVLARTEYWSYRLKREITAISAQSFPTTLSEASRYHPALPSDADGFAALRQSGTPSWAGPPPMTSPLPGVSTSGVMQSAILLRANVRQNETQLRVLWRLPKFQRAYMDPLGNDLWQQQAIHNTYSAILDADATLTMNGPAPVDVERLVLDIRAFLAHARLLRQQPIGLAQQCANESLRRLINVLQEILKRDLLDEKVLQTLTNDAFVVDDPKVLARTLASQRVFFLEPVPNQWGPMAAPRAMPGSFQSILTRLLDNLGTRDKTIIEVLQEYEKAIVLANSPYPRSFNPAMFYDERRMMRVQQLRTGLFDPSSSIPDVFWHDAAFTANLHLIQAALGLERYQRRYSKLPTDLAALVPEFLPFVPIDPYTGKPLSTFPGSDAHLIYSISADLQDDTANVVTRTKRTGGDIIFIFR